MDGGAYKKADYPQIEKYFEFQWCCTKLYNETVDLAEFNETKTDQVDCTWLSSQNGDDIALIYLRDNKNQATTVCIVSCIYHMMAAQLLQKSMSLISVAATLHQIIQRNLSD